ncbi:DUF4097 family beta strand repeat-containing protein [Micromonospora sonneratiae]|uniref:DUF4097 domain-containing protein n=1 Tax=Micromonospora sonneratiae TaxID=1184706 RepID=A0ABW3YN22_9ACTN
MANWTVKNPLRLTVDDPVSQLDVRLVTGRLNVVGTDGPARVEVTRVGRMPITVEYHEGRLVVRHERHWRWTGLLPWFTLFGRRWQVDVSIAVPATVRAELQLVDGSVVASGLHRSTTVEVTSGQITLMGLRGRTTATLVSGPVKALGVAGDLAMETTSGELILADGSAERIRANTVSGAITCDLDNPQHSDIQLSATSGSVTVRVREDSDLAVRLHTTSGRITSAFPQIQPGGRYALGKESRGILGTGEGQLSASSTSGSISLLARPVDDELADPAATPDPSAMVEEAR